MNVVVLGNVCIDKNISENANYTSAGGPAVFIYKILKQIPNVSVDIISPYGWDFWEYRKKIKILHQNQENIPDKTLVYENISRNGVRTQKAFKRESGYTPEITEIGKFVLQKADIIFVAPLLPNLTYKYLEDVLSNANKESLRVLIPQGFFRDFDSQDNVISRKFTENEILSFFDLVFVSDKDSSDMEKTVKEWVAKFDIKVIMTTGRKGAVAITKKGNITLPTKAVKEENIVDTVGSGDIFSAAFAYKYYLTKNIEESGHFANEIARQSLFFTPDNIKIDLSKI